MAPTPRVLLAGALAVTAALLHTTSMPTVGAVLTGAAVGALSGFLFHEGNAETEQFMRSLLGFRRPLSAHSKGSAGMRFSPSPSSRSRASSPYRRRKQSNSLLVYGAGLAAAAALIYYLDLLDALSTLLYSVVFLAVLLLVCSVGSFALTLWQLGWTYTRFRAALQGSRAAPSDRKTSTASPTKPQRVASSGRAPARATSAGNTVTKPLVSSSMTSNSKIVSTGSTSASSTSLTRPEWDSRTKGPPRPMYRSVPPPSRMPIPLPLRGGTPEYTPAPLRGPTGPSARPARGPPMQHRAVAGQSYSVPPPARAQNTEEAIHHPSAYDRIGSYGEQNRKAQWGSDDTGWLGDRRHAPQYFHTPSRSPRDAGSDDDSHGRLRPLPHTAVAPRRQSDPRPGLYPNARYEPSRPTTHKRPPSNPEPGLPFGRHQLSGSLDEPFPASVQPSPRPPNPVIGMDPAEEYPPPRRMPRPVTSGVLPQGAPRGSDHPRDALLSHEAGAFDETLPEPDVDEEDELQELQEQIRGVQRNLAGLRR
eukprot:GGOE01019161.1.p1 GENE.GGOE01019161.1~~GGOE01019161.1.p1  ORF type:complete len:549 (+),score=42.21 GGOE01019161.1:53-1648(+)